MADLDAAVASNFEYNGVKYPRLGLAKLGELTAMRRAEKRDQLSGVLAATTLPPDQKANRLVSASVEMIDIYEMQHWMETESGFRAALRLSLAIAGKTEQQADAIIEKLNAFEASTLGMIVCSFKDFETTGKEATANPPQAVEASTQNVTG